MTERRSRRRKREEEDDEEEDGEPSDEQTEIAKYLRFNCLTKSSNYHSEKVEYFKGSKAIDCLLDSKWASGQKGAEILFTDRESAQDYLHELLELGLFKRVTRVRKKKKGEKDDGKKSKDGKDSPKSGKSKKDSTADGSTEAEGKKKKVKVKLELHDEQMFLDGDEVYMWIYDPVHPRTIIYGVLVVMGAIVLCLFPLWPMQMREYVWYISVLAAILLGALLVLALLRYVIFAFVWLFTAGRHHFWLLPNLTEECGFFESFVPLYTHAYITDSKDKKDTQDSQGQKEDKDNNGDKDDENNQYNEKNDEGNDDPNNDDTPSTSKATNSETEPWVQVTDEDVAQAKEATGNESDVQTKTDSEVAC